MWGVVGGGQEVNSQNLIRFLLCPRYGFQTEEQSGGERRSCGTSADRPTVLVTSPSAAASAPVCTRPFHSPLHQVSAAQNGHSKQLQDRGRGVSDLDLQQEDPNLTNFHIHTVNLKEHYTCFSSTDQSVDHYKLRSPIYLSDGRAVK